MNNNHGGKREGAGRPIVPPATRKISISVTVSPAIVDLLQNYADAVKTNRSAAAEHFLRLGLGL